MSPAPRYTLSYGDLILRGCEREPAHRLLESMREHHRSPRTADEWGLSVAATPGQGELGILESAGQIRQSHYRVAAVESMNDLSDDTRSVPYEMMGALTRLQVTWDHNAHGLIVSRNEPTLELCSAIGAAFGPPKRNPYHEQRRRRAGRR